MATQLQTEDGFFSRRSVRQVVWVTLTAGAGSEACTFDVSFKNPPQVKLVIPEGAQGTYAAASVTASGFTLNVSSEADNLAAKKVPVIVFAHEGL